MSEQNWQPIETAPKDEWIVAFRPKPEVGRWATVVIVKWDDNAKAFGWAPYFDIYDDDMDEKDARDRYVFDPCHSLDFTHWAPLPASSPTNPPALSE